MDSEFTREDETDWHVAHPDDWDEPEYYAYYYEEAPVPRLLLFPLARHPPGRFGRGACFPESSQRRVRAKFYIYRILNLR